MLGPALKTWAILALGAMILGAASCGDGNDDGSLTTRVTRERAGLSLTLTLDKGRYDTGDTVEVTAVAKNTTAEAIEIGFVLPGEPSLRLALTTDLAGEQVLNPGDPETLSPNIVLGPGETVAAESRWDQQLATYETSVAAPAGRYVITSMINIAASGAQDVITVSAAVEFELRGGASIIPQAEVIGLALAEDEVKEWFSNRQATVICAIAGLGRFYRGSSVTGEVREVPVAAYDAQVESGFPICSPVTAEDEWRVIFLSPGGPDPVRVSAYLGLNDGEFLRLETDETPGAAGGSE